MGPSSVLELPLLPLRDVVVYPHMVLPLFVGREKSIEALEDAMASDKQVLLVAQRNAAEDNPSADDMYQVGTVSNILQLLKLPDGTIKVLVEGVYRAVIDSVNDDGPFAVAGVREVEAESGSVGMNAATGEMQDLLAAGIIDPAKVTRAGLQNAASIAAMVLTTECLVADEPEDEPMAMPGGGGMGGMGGMM